MDFLSGCIWILILDVGIGSLQELVMAMGVYVLEDDQN